MKEKLLNSSPDEQKEKFYALTTVQELVELLEYDYGHLTYHIYKVPVNERYKGFELSKKDGGIRKISAPNSGLKFIQQKLNEVLMNVYRPKPIVYGFVPNRNIVQHARRHKRRKWVFNIDIENFFGVINFGRVRGMFMGKPYLLPENVATVLAQICVYDNQLPQGAPTSPVISNMLCRKMDSELQDLAWKNRCYCTRYADDITFSTTLAELPKAVAEVHNIKNVLGVKVGDELRQVVEGNGFSINQKKVRVYSSQVRQEVTGLTVNRFPNVRRRYIKQIRAMLYAWDKHGYANAERYHHEHFSKQYNPDEKPPSFKKIVKGKIDFLGMVKGRKNEKFLAFKNEYKRLVARDKNVPGNRYFSERISSSPHIYVEGPTDVQILKVAWKKLYDIECPYVIAIPSPKLGSC